jgi:hypothetical protein
VSSDLRSTVAFRPIHSCTLRLSYDGFLVTLHFAVSKALDSTNFNFERVQTRTERKRSRSRRIEAVTLSPGAQAPRSSVKMAHKLDNSRDYLQQVIDSRLVGVGEVIRTADSHFERLQIPLEKK